MGIADNTIVVWTTDNGAEKFTWPDGGATPFHGEKATTWEGGFRVPAVVRWPGRIPAGKVVNGIVSHQDWVPTLMAAVGEPVANRRFARYDYEFHIGREISYLTRMDLFLFFSLALAILAFGEAVLTAVLQASDREALALRIDRWARWLFPAAFAALHVAMWML